MNTVDCLANTGASPWGPLFLGAVAVVLIALGLIAIRGHKRRGRAAALGALALIGALALAPLAPPTAAQAATGDCTPSAAQPTTTQTPTPTPPPTPTPTPTPDPEVTPVTPVAPTSAPVCGAPPVITTPHSDYFTYTTTHVGSVATVTARLKPGLDAFTVDPEAKTAWTFDLSFTPVTVLTPEDLAFTFDGSTGDLAHADTAAFLEAQKAPFTFVVQADYRHTYGVFRGGVRLPEYGETTQPTSYTARYTASQSGQTTNLAYVDAQFDDGYPKAIAYFTADGSIPEDTVVGIVEETAHVSFAQLGVAYVNECGITNTVTATTPYELPNP
ncbi:hypothetical protein EDF62_1497 [Leucobacter luti]|uniref:LPXTG-motif cell wall-anchored protein n=1 Tax=Leucobacter luti TaxID=340320 RepID=A0A4R6S455_9MICO|nr:hypothetical protein [Leucobacter luti]TDP93516.1 hypothetical protein EDF62_1497 [Leucobacter luti]